MTNLLQLGVNINLDEIDAETLHYIEYFGMKRRAKEEEERFKALAELLKRCFSK